MCHDDEDGNEWLGLLPPEGSNTTAKLLLLRHYWLQKSKAGSKRFFRCPKHGACKVHVPVSLGTIRTGHGCMHHVHPPKKSIVGDDGGIVAVGNDRHGGGFFIGTLHTKLGENKVGWKRKNSQSSTEWTSMTRFLWHW
jgi:hypothetical protein